MFPLALKKSSILSKNNYIKNPRDRLIYLLIKEIGLKVSEVSSLKKNNFSKKYILLRNSKIELSDDILKTLSDYLENTRVDDSQNPYLFKTRQGARISERRIQQILSSYGLDTPSKIRSQCILEGVSTKSSHEVKTQFGLKSLREKEYLNKNESDLFRSFLNSSNNVRDLAISLLFLELGLTLNQVINLEKSDVRSNSIKIKTIDGRFSDKKEGTVKVFQISIQLAQLLRNVSLSSNSNYIFSSRQGSKYSERRIQQIFDDYSSKLGFRVTPQVLRNTFVANQLILSSKENFHSKSDSKPEHLRKMHFEYIARIRVYDGYHGLPKGESETT